MNNNKVGKRIQEYREKRKISQEFMADSVGLSVTAVSNIERGLNYPTFENFIKIVNVIGVSTDLLLADVVDAAYVAKVSELSEKLKTVSTSKRQQIFRLIETMIDTED